MSQCVPAALNAALTSFLEALQIKCYSPATLTTYARSLGVLFRFLAQVGVDDVRELTREHVRGFHRWLNAKTYTACTRSTHLQAIRRFFDHLEKNDAIFINPGTSLVLPRITGRLPRGVLTSDEARKILDTPDSQSPAGLRDRAILEVFYSTGLRLNELARLAVSDVDWKDGFVRVNNGKGGRDRMVPLGAKACEHVREYLAKIRPRWTRENQDEQALWLTSNLPHGPLGSQAIQWMVKLCGRKCGLRVTPHLWRHTCATHMVASGAGIATVQRQLGHQSLRTTQIYTRVAVPDLVAMHRKAHPRSRPSLAQTENSVTTANS